MTTVRQLLTIALLLTATALAACEHPTYLRYPLSPPGGAGYDERLIGEWISRGDRTGDVYQLWITPSEAEGEDGMLRIAATLTSMDFDNEDGVLLARFERIAYPSVVDGRTYYNIRSTGVASQFVLLGPTGPRAPDPDDVDWLMAPKSAEREYWIATAEVSSDDRLSLRFISIPLLINSEVWEDSERSPEILYPYLVVHGQGASFWMGNCTGYGCTRASIEPEVLAGLIRAYPIDLVFSLPAGPFARAEAVLPRYDVPK